ncbi:hypothetical protein RW1_073_00110 [Rhodococcus wratislaviensis NBRC 100605]|uniref:Uncharacterized protein n=1 Tax=Rhodococcus wratislaviensis NBRC 100605 TaxID=1219028 RepID=X0QCE6_RHOWR|nr:hypothetical protein RW1_073_00110 [Rhodococcus wratislaviensis NBRC 100605]
MLCLRHDPACRTADHITTEPQLVFDLYRDAQILTSFPWLGALSGTRIIRQIGDDRTAMERNRTARVAPPRAHHRRYAATDTPQPDATCSTDSSDNFTAAWPPAICYDPNCSFPITPHSELRITH